MSAKLRSHAGPVTLVLLAVVPALTLVGLIALMFLPETKDRPLPED